VLRDAHPVVRALFAHKLKEQLIFFGDPRSTAVGGSHEREGERKKGEIERGIRVYTKDKAYRELGWEDGCRVGRLEVEILKVGDGRRGGKLRFK
jgi:hypothetical protein